MPKSSKWSRSEDNSLPSAKRFDFTMVDDDFEELQRGFVPKETNIDTKKCVKLFNDWASARNHHSSSTLKGCRMTFSSLITIVCSHSGWPSFARKPGSRMVSDIHPKPYSII